MLRIRPRRASSGWLVLTVLLSACQTAMTEPARELPRVLVTFDENAFEARRISNGSPRTYYSGDWAVSARVSQQIGRVGKRYGLHRLDAWPIKSLGVQCVLFAVPNDRDLDQLLVQIAAEPGVDAAQRLNEFDALAEPSGSELRELQWGTHAGRVAALHQLSRGGASRVGIVDTLVDAHHPDLRTRALHQYAFAGESSDGLLHGTAVAGVIAADGNSGHGLLGIAPDAKLYIYGACRSVADGGARCDSFSLAKALERAQRDHLGILNLSLTGPRDELLARLLTALLSEGVIVVAAADPARPSGGFPASLNGVFGVSGSLNVTAQSATTPTPIDSCLQWIFDPERLSTRAGGGYQFFYGSSMSAAGVSGFAALLRSGSNALETTSELQQLLTGGLPTRNDAEGAFIAAVHTALVCDEPGNATVAGGDSYPRDAHR